MTKLLAWIDATEEKVIRAWAWYQEAPMSLGDLVAWAFVVIIVGGLICIFVCVGIATFHSILH